MATITPPDSDADYPDLALECQEAVDLPLQALIADATAAGWSTIEVFTAVEEVVKALRLGYGEDPDPDEDEAPAVDPSNDWPAAD